MLQPPALKASLKRGAFVAAANWPLVAVQFIAAATPKLLLAVPVIGGIVMVVLLLGAEIDEIMAGGVTDTVRSVFVALRDNPAALVAFGAAFLLVLLGGALLTFVVKGGTVAILAAAEQMAGPIERPPLRLAALRRANLTAIEPFLDGSRKFWRRYVKLGVCLLLVHGATATIFLGFVSRGYALVGNMGALLGLTFATALALGALLVWVRIVHSLYQLTQMAIAVEDLGVLEGMVRVAQFIRASTREVVGIFGVVLLLVVLATIASILATAGLSLIAFVPLVGLAILPLQAAAWLVRGFVFEYLELTAMGAYLTQYRYFLHNLAVVPAHEAPSEIPGQRLA
jgi:hypothetical protein